jgi:hypothetical protein
VIDLWEGNVFLIDTGCIGIEAWSSLNSTANWSVLVDLCLHLFDANGTAVLADVVEIWDLDRAVMLPGFAGRWRWGCACLAEVQRVCCDAIVSIGWVFRLVLLARIIGDTVVMREFVYSLGVATVAVTPGATVDCNLWGDANFWPRVVAKDVDAISNA